MTEGRPAAGRLRYADFQITDVQFLQRTMNDNERHSVEVGRTP